jgi:putative two-component system response regulator
MSFLSPNVVETVMLDADRLAMECMIRAESARYPAVGRHGRRVGQLVRELCARMGVDEPFSRALAGAAVLHDIGKITIPDAIIGKPGRLTAEEWAVMKTHAVAGYEILSGSGSAFLELAAAVALTHHEHFDGTGYPRGLAGAEIPLAGRIVAICDAYDAIREQRPYKPALDHDTAVRLIVHGDERSSPTQFDPDVLAAFIAVAPAFKRIIDEPARVDGELAWAA